VRQSTDDAVVTLSDQATELTGASSGTFVMVFSKDKNARWWASGPTETSGTRSGIFRPEIISSSLRTTSKRASGTIRSCCSS